MITGDIVMYEVYTHSEYGRCKNRHFLLINVSISIINCFVTSQCHYLAIVSINNEFCGIFTQLRPPSDVRASCGAILV